MISKFSVSNFKSFNNNFIFDLKNTNGYAFNDECIKNGLINSSLIYGHNGVGKSNLGFALFDIIGHLSDKRTTDSEYSNYLNAFQENSTASFCYEFLINSNTIVYEYKKTNFRTIVSEKFTLNGVELAYIDRTINNFATINFKGTETLKSEIDHKNISVLKYIKNNAVLEDALEKAMFISFFDFIDGMLFFRSLQRNMFLGLEVGGEKLSEYIIEKGRIKDFETFLNKAGIECQLSIEEVLGSRDIAFNFNGKLLNFMQNASQGTKSLTLFYFWLQKLQEHKVSFLFIDEFDAFYHYELSAMIVDELKKTGVQFVLTSHNTSIITNDLLRPDCYFIMKKDKIKSLAKSTSKELREAHNIEKMFKSGTFND